MNRILLTLTLLFGFSGGLILAADQPASAAEHGSLQSRMQEIVDQLQLTPEQKAQLAPIVEKEAADLQALRDDNSLTRMQRARRARAINNNARKEIRALLTPEQQKTFDEIRAETRARMKEKRKERRSTESPAN